MEAIRVETTVQTDGVLTVEGLLAGERVEVIVLRLSAPGEPRYPLRGTPARYDDPFGPAIPLAEWDVS